ncbi:MAG: hypothetical protein ACREQI_07625 [Candidatus Binataceae bacterium]
MELQNKASILGFYGILPFVEFSVQNENLPVLKLTFTLLSGSPVTKGTYRVRLSVKGPQGNELVPASNAPPSVIGEAPLSVVISCQPFPIVGYGEYKVTAIVNDQPDLSSTFRIRQQQLAN